MYIYEAQWGVKPNQTIIAAHIVINSYFCSLLFQLRKTGSMIFNKISPNRLDDSKKICIESLLCKLIANRKAFSCSTIN